MRVFVAKVQSVYRVWHFLAVFMVFLTACATSQPSRPGKTQISQDAILESIPYRLDAVGRMLIEVHVNDQGPFLFILDTASSRTLLYESTREKLGLDFTEDQTTFVHGSVISERRPVLPIRKVMVGKLVLASIKSFSLPDPFTTDLKPAGVLGLDFLSSYAMFINVEAQTITFLNSNFQARRRDYVSVPITIDRLDILAFGVPIIPVKLQGQQIDGLLDLGAASTITNWATANKIGVNVRRFLRGRFDYRGVFSSIPIRVQATGATLSIGGRIWRDQNIDIASLKIFETLKRREQPAIIVSATLLREENFIIDFPRARLYLKADKSQREQPQRQRCDSNEIGQIICGPAGFIQGLAPIDPQTQ